MFSCIEGRSPVSVVSKVVSHIQSFNLSALIIEISSAHCKDPISAPVEGSCPTTDCGRTFFELTYTTERLIQ